MNKQILIESDRACQIAKCNEERNSIVKKKLEGVNPLGTNECVERFFSLKILIQLFPISWSFLVQVMQR